MWRQAVDRSMALCCGPGAAAGPPVHRGPGPGLSGRGRRCCGGAPLARGGGRRDGEPGHAEAS